MVIATRRSLVPVGMLKLQSFNNNVSTVHLGYNVVSFLQSYAGLKKIPHTQKFIRASSANFNTWPQMNHRMKYDRQERTVSYANLSIRSRFWAFKVRLWSVDGAYNNLCVRYFLGTRESQIAISKIMLYLERFSEGTSIIDSMRSNRNRERYRYCEPPLSKLSGWKISVHGYCLHFRVFVRWAMAIGNGWCQNMHGYPTSAYWIRFLNFVLLFST